MQVANGKTDTGLLNVMQPEEPPKCKKFLDAGAVRPEVAGRRRPRRTRESYTWCILTKTNCELE